MATYPAEQELVDAVISAYHTTRMSTVSVGEHVLGHRPVQDALRRLRAEAVAAQQDALQRLRGEADSTQYSARASKAEGDSLVAMTARLRVAETLLADPELLAVHKLRLLESFLLQR